MSKKDNDIDKDKDVDKDNDDDDFDDDAYWVALGTAASRLRRLSEGGVPLPPSPVPLPDIIPVGRDRSLSVPDFQALARRQRAQEVGRRVGRELRRLSDEFNFSFSPRRNLSPVHEEFDGHPASFPQVRPSRLRSTFSHFGAFLRETFGGRRSSSVDLVGQAASAEPPDQSEEDQGE